MNGPGFLRRAALATVLAFGASTPACLRRDVTEIDPSTKTVFEDVVPQPAVDKIDLLVMVDNSASMADKQRILADAVPDLVRGLVQPKCVDKKTRRETAARAGESPCPSGSEPAFTPITDMHIGVITSSLGGFGAVQSRTGRPVCDPSQAAHGDDRGRLVARGEDGARVPEAGGLGFLAWYPDVPKNEDKVRHPEPPVPAIRALGDLDRAFRSLVVGVGQDGCGLEAQLESVYRFLVQPDPWTGITVEGGKASYGPRSEVDMELLRQRAAFLRPDSLVAVVMLTDEDDSSPDPLAFEGTGYRFNQDAPLPRATSVCAQRPADPACTSCSFAGARSDPACASGPYSEAEDVLNVRYARVKQRFGVDPQFPVQRYADAFTAPRVPSREAEHEKGRYVGRADCTNPLYAAKLPTSPGEEWCKLPRGPRSKELVLFALIGGVPNRLLPDGERERELVDWTPILGREPARWDESGIDPHMIASTAPRPGLPGPGAKADADPDHGREWTTGGKDLQYACTFPLVERGADGAPRAVTRACATPGSGACDCDGKSDSPLCDPSNKLVQVRGKAYPSRRPLLLAKELAQRAVVASLCPRQLEAPDRDDYGYRPAARRIVEKLSASLVASCLPRPLVRDADGELPCLVLAQLAEEGTQADCARRGLVAPDPAVLATFRARRLAEDFEDVSATPVCEVPPLDVTPGETCKDDDRLGYCAVEGVPGLACTSALAFTKGMARFPGARFTMQCIQRAGAP